MKPQRLMLGRQLADCAFDYVFCSPSIVDGAGLHREAVDRGAVPGVQPFLDDMGAVHPGAVRALRREWPQRLLFSATAHVMVLC